MLLYLMFGRVDEAALIMGTLPLALIGGFWLRYLLGCNLSVAGVVGFIALADVAAEFGVMLYLKQAWAVREPRGDHTTQALLSLFVVPAVYLLMRRRRADSPAVSPQPASHQES